MPKDPEILLERYLAISKAIAGQMDFQSVLGEISDEVHQLFEHDHLDISITLPDRRDYNVSFEVGLSTEWGQKTDTPHFVGYSPIRDLLTGKVSSLLTDDACNDERFHFDGAFDSPIYDANLRSRVHVPLYVHNEIQGALNISSHQKGKYTEEDVKAAQQIADLLAPYFYALTWGDQAKNAALSEGAARGREEALRIGTLRLTEAMENERKHIGMDLHDQTLADLTRISRHISRISRKPQAVPTDMTKLATEINLCMSELRRIIEDTKPSVMDLFGFAQAIEAQLERSVAGIQPPIKTDVNDTASTVLDACPDSLRTTVFRIVQEAINNAVKHGSPRNIQVVVRAEGNYLCVSVIDDGSGTPLESEISMGGMDNMRVRAALISADLTVSGDEADGGTRVTIMVPLQGNPSIEGHENTPRSQLDAAQ